jgi:hypothetical protein
VARLRLIIVTAALLVLVAQPAAARAASSQGSVVNDNRLLLDDTPQLDLSLIVLRQMGVERVQVAIDWAALAPSPSSRRVPSGLVATDPAAYAAAAWAPYDRLLTEARRYGLDVTFEIGGPAPLWATRRAPPAGRLAAVWYPAAGQFGAFVTAVGERYGGQYIPAGAAGPLPAVSSWSIWEEPNTGGSLAPQVVKGAEIAPSIYRGLAGAAYRALRATGHRHDTILVGGLDASGQPHPGPSGATDPLRFVRALYCVDARGRKLTGKPAAQRGCPTTAAASRRFRSANPALFGGAGWAERPYYGSAAPDHAVSTAHPDWVTFAELPALERVLDGLQAAYRSHHHLAIYISAYGFNTNPPQRQDAVGLGVQAAYLNEAEYLAWRDRRIRSIAQYRLIDGPQSASLRSLTVSGLIFATGKPKPAFSAYTLPLWIPEQTVARGTSQEVWGCIRPADFTIADTHAPITAQVQFQPGSSGQFLWIGSVTVSSTRSCYFDVHLQFPESGTVRLAYTYPKGDPYLPAGVTIYSRAVRVALEY